MRKSIVRAFAGVLFLALIGVSGAEAQYNECYQTGVITRQELVGESYPSSDCWFDATPNAMVTYIWTVRSYQVNRYATYQCTYGYQYEQFLGTVYSFTNSCWLPTPWECVGWQDWEPSPQCS